MKASEHKLTPLRGDEPRAQSIFSASKAPGPRGRLAGGWRRVADALHTDIIFGRLLPRERLVEDLLIERFATSRYSVRAALEEMQRLGLIVREPNRGACVRDYTRVEVEELFEMLETLEAQAIRRMQLPLAEETLLKLESLQKAHEKASSDDKPLDLFAFNKAFHDTLFDACGNTHLARAIRDYALLIDPIRMRRIPDKNWRREAALHHRKMIDLLRGSNHEALVQLCLDHIEPTKEFYLSIQAY